jgi:hypothetical protein
MPRSAAALHALVSFLFYARKHDETIAQDGGGFGF